MSGRKKPPNSRHSIADHLYGEGLFGAHEHGPDVDHDHDDIDPGPIEENAIFLQDNVRLTSVGMDIGSAGTQVIFSRIHLRRLGEELSSRYHVVSRETLYQSPVALTPYRGERIDEAKLGGIIDEAYAAAGLGTADIDTGVVILTGEALRRENAEAITGLLAEGGGEFVCATAGHRMEAMLAAYGSGAARVSHDAGKRILNVDIGGGTTKLALVEGGWVLKTAAIHIGGRLQVVDKEGRIVRLEPTGRRLAAAAGFDWELGDHAAPEAMDRVADWMAAALVAALGQQPPPAAVAALHLTEPLGDLGPVGGIMFSGGVAEFVYGRETRDFGDMGRRLGLALRAKLDAGALPWPLLPAGECIRATALGASEYSVQLSGNTIFISDSRALLPRRNLQVLQPAYDPPDEIDPERLEQAICAHFAAFDLVEGETEIALALRWRGAPSYARLKRFATGIASGLANTIASGKPLHLVLDGDVAQMLGHLLREEFAPRNDLLVIDGIVLWDFDYIDIGRIRLPSNTVPVTVKSLVFG
ncbi:MAG: ethanolamine ammonia-lyase reactivating factor EutA, partial [Pseudomonadota bacterium]|nr:ethanolamine ammonia-lyase reactivating factor EutA [Pseudomonadota bacterium]